jgi:hypothetical protein
MSGILQSMEDLEKVVQDCLAMLLDLVETPSSDEMGAASATRVFMKKLFHVYLLVKKNPALQENSAYQSFLQSSVLLLGRAEDGIIGFKIGIENLFNIDPTYNPWPEVCWRRSAFEALKEMYQFTLGTHFQEENIDLSLDDYDTEDIDYMIDGYALSGGPISEDRIPVGIPHSHWWWWGKKVEAEVA